LLLPNICSVDKQSAIMKVSTFMLAALALAGAQESPDDETTSQLRRRTANNLVDPKTVEYKHGASKIMPVGVTAPLLKPKTNEVKSVVKTDAKTAVKPVVKQQAVVGQKPVVESPIIPTKTVQEVKPLPQPKVVKEQKDDHVEPEKADVQMSKPSQVNAQIVGKTGNRRKFVSYRSSEWEQMW
jgi:hypothetical protein